MPVSVLVQVQNERERERLTMGHGDLPHGASARSRGHASLLVIAFANTIPVR